MKIRTLFLKAFGPFTDTVLDFSGPASLHLVFGANEAGKSSALRAMADLRYGIPMRSQDDFVHAFKAMLLAATFEDAAGNAVALARRKGNKDTLSPADPATGEPRPGGLVPPDVVLALTGGVAREQFETMYGLDPARLRRGGQQLIQGEGDLGAALFAASTGSANSRAMLASLQADARRYFAPRGQNMLINEAQRQLDEARQRYRLALTRPEQWKVLDRAHRQAADGLAQVRASLAESRRELAELTELRVVEPLLRQRDQVAGQWAQVQAHVALAADARETRLSAQRDQAQAQADLAQADADDALVRATLDGLQADPVVLREAQAIDRLAADMAGARQAQAERVRMEASAQVQAGQLALEMRRLAGDTTVLPAPAEFFARLPSAADQTRLAGLLSLCRTCQQGVEQARARQQAAQARLAPLQADAPRLPGQPERAVLAHALAQARALGDAEHRLAELLAAQTSEQRRLDQALRDLGLDGPAALDRTRWMAPADIVAQEHARAELERRRAQHEADLETWRNDLLAVGLELAGWAARGEVVTADSLAQARAARDQAWGQVRARCVDGVANPAPTPTPLDLALAFERAQGESDRQADLLRAGAEQAATVAQLQGRIAAMQARQASTGDALMALEAERRQMEEGWSQALAAHGLPALGPAALRDWQALRATALERQERLSSGAPQCRDLQARITAACAVLRSGLEGVGRSPAPADSTLADLLRLAGEAERDIDAAAAQSQRRDDEIGRARQDLAQAQQDEAGHQDALTQCRSALDAQAQALHLALGAAPEAVEARLSELANWAAEWRRHAEQLQQLAAARAGADALQGQTEALAGLLGEPVGAHAQAWVDGLRQRLKLAQQAQVERAAADLRRRQIAQGRARAQALLQRALDTLTGLEAQAGVQGAEALEQAEARAQQRREVESRLQELDAQLARTAARGTEALRAALQGRDSTAIDGAKQACAAQIAQLEATEIGAIAAEEQARAALAAVDTSDAAAQAREAMEVAIARYRGGVRPWAQLRLAEALLAEALRRHRDKAQGPVLARAGAYFRLITAGRFERLLVDDSEQVPVLKAQPAGGAAVGVQGLSEGTADQLHLALRLAALEVQRSPERTMPLVLDDVFITSDDQRSVTLFRALAEFAQHGQQVLVFTHHRHLLDIARDSLPADVLRVHRLGGAAV